jgi:hypothetical protein
VFVADDTPCTDDGLFCTGDEECQSGMCVGEGDPCTMGSCDETTNQCLAVGCEAAPLAGCDTSALKSILVVKDKSPDSKDKLIWKWLKGTAVQGDFADPVNTADYTLCIYTPQGLVSESVVPPAGGKWSAISTKGYKYKDTGTNDGVTKIIVKSNSSPGKTKAQVKGRGANLPDIGPASNPALDLDLPVKVQLVNEDNGGKFKGKAQ